MTQNVENELFGVVHFCPGCAKRVSGVYVQGFPSWIWTPGRPNLMLLSAKTLHFFDNFLADPFGLKIPAFRPGPKIGHFGPATALVGSPFSSSWTTGEHGPPAASTHDKL